LRRLLEVGGWRPIELSSPRSISPSLSSNAPLKASRSFLTAIALVALLHAYIGLRLVPDLELGSVGTALIYLLLAASAMFVPMSMLTRSLDRPTADRLAWVGFSFMGAFSSFLVMTLARDVLLLIAWPFAMNDMPQLRYFSALAAIGLAMAMTIIGLINARRRARVVDTEIPIADLPEALHGFSIVQISDVHVGATIKRAYVQAIVDAVNALDADAIAVTGDIVDGSVRDLAHHVEPLSQLRARHGAFFVTGNHEYYSGEAQWTREFRRLGLTVLLNQHVVLSHGEATLVFAGVTDYGAHHFNPAHRSDPAAALAGAPQAHARILLAHQPRSAPAAAAAGFDLQLSGHTHGGQFWPWNHFVRFQQPYTAGLHRLNALWIYISRGTGYWGPPKRFGAPSEISRLRLVRAVSDSNGREEPQKNT
jgi:predicted MPP superfamily phosphohydrolase